MPQPLPHRLHLVPLPSSLGAARHQTQASYCVCSVHYRPTIPAQRGIGAVGGARATPGALVLTSERPPKPRTADPGVYREVGTGACQFAAGNADRTPDTPIQVTGQSQHSHVVAMGKHQRT